jgi:hypothetical protein
MPTAAVVASSRLQPGFQAQVAAFVVVVVVVVLLRFTLPGPARKGVVHETVAVVAGSRAGR